MNPVFTPKPYFFEIHFSIFSHLRLGLPSVLLLGFSTEILYGFSFALCLLHGPPERYLFSTSAM
jgi:hypothetical protein